MIRTGILAVLLVSFVSDVSQARNRNRVMMNRGVTWQYQNPATNYYNTSTMPFHSQHFQTQQSYTNGVSTNGVHTIQQTQPVQQIQTTQQVQSVPHIQPISYQSSNGLTYSQGNSMQAWAEEEARMMAMRGTCGHIRPAPPGYFVGVGCGTTCMGSGTLVAEAHFQGKMVRVWRR